MGRGGEEGRSPKMTPIKPSNPKSDCLRWYFNRRFVFILIHYAKEISRIVIFPCTQECTYVYKKEL